jgi:LmbE family N-acetylglucosaminyl deacetylase
MSFNNVLILSPHTDDAELGAAGFISKLIEEGKNIYWVVFSTAEDSLPEGMAPDTLRKEFINVTKHLELGEDNYKIFNYKVRNLDAHRQEVLETLVKIRKEFKPDLVLGPSLNDYHQDHRVVCMEMIRAFKTSSSILCYELPWNHIEFNAQYFVKLEKRHIEKKISLLNYYKSQQVAQRHYFNEGFIEGLARVKGTQINSEYAEAFDVIRMVH